MFESDVLNCECFHINDISTGKTEMISGRIISTKGISGVIFKISN